MNGLKEAHHRHFDDVILHGLHGNQVWEQVLLTLYRQRSTCQKGRKSKPKKWCSLKRNERHTAIRQQGKANQNHKRPLHTHQDGHNNQCWRCGEIGNPYIAGRNIKMVQQLWKIAQQFLKMSELLLLCDPTISPRQWSIPKKISISWLWYSQLTKMWKQCKCLSGDYHWRNKIGYLYSRPGFTHEKGLNTTCHNMDEP